MNCEWEGDRTFAEGDKEMARTLVRGLRNFVLFFFCDFGISITFMLRTKRYKIANTNGLFTLTCPGQVRLITAYCEMYLEGETMRAWVWVKGREREREELAGQASRGKLGRMTAIHQPSWPETSRLDTMLMGYIIGELATQVSQWRVQAQSQQVSNKSVQTVI